MILRRTVQSEVVRTHEHDAVLFRDRKILVRHVESVFDRSDAGKSGVVRTGSRPTVRGKLQSHSSSFVDHELDVLDGVDVTLIINDEFYYRRSVMRILADRLDHLVARVGKEIFGLAEILLIR